VSGVNCRIPTVHSHSHNRSLLSGHQLDACLGVQARSPIGQPLAGSPRPRATSASAPHTPSQRDQLPRRRFQSKPNLLLNYPTPYRYSRIQARRAVVSTRRCGYIEAFESAKWHRDRERYFWSISSTARLRRDAYRIRSSCWPLHEIAITNIVWCMTYKRGSRDGVVYCAIAVK